MAPCRSSSIWISPTAGGTGKQKPFDFVDFVDDVAIPMFDDFRHARFLKDATFLPWHPKLLSQTAERDFDGRAAGLVESDVSEHDSGDESYAVGKGTLVGDGLEHEPAMRAEPQADELDTSIKSSDRENESDDEIDEHFDQYEGDDESVGSDDDNGSETSLPMEFPDESVPRQLVRVVDDWVAQFDEDDLDCKAMEEDVSSQLTDEGSEQSSDESCFGQSSEEESEEGSDAESDESSDDDSDDSIEDYQQHSVSSDESDDDSELEVKSLSARLANVVDKWGIDGEEDDDSYSSEDSLTSEEDDEGNSAYESDLPSDEGGYENDANEVSSDEEDTLDGEVDKLSTTLPKHVPTNLPACQIPLGVILALNSTDLD